MKKLLIFMFLLLTVFSYSKSTAPQANVTAAYESLSVTRPVFADVDVQKFADDYALFVQPFVYIMNTKDKNAVGKLEALQANIESQADLVDQKINQNPVEYQKFEAYVNQMVGILGSYEWQLLDLFRY